MEKSRKKKPRLMKRLLLLDGALVLGTLAAIVVLIVTRVSGGGASKAEAPESVPGAAAAPSEAAPSPEGQLAYFSWGSSGEAPVSIDFDQLAAAGVPAVGWLYCEGTSINSPVVQGKDNEYYMSRSAFGKKDAAGAIYLDCRNSAGLQDEQIMIYGNPMADGTMFGGLTQYREQSFFDAHPSMYLITPEGAYRIDLYAAHTASPEMSNYPIWFENEMSRNTYIRAQQTGSFFTSPNSVGAGKLISLVTTSDYDAGENARLVLNGELTPLF